MRLAVGQAPASHHVGTNIASAVRLVHAAAVQGARLLVLSELFLSGYDLDGPDGTIETFGIDDPRLTPISSACAADGVTALVGAATVASDGGPPHNSLLAFGADGSIHVAYRKTHLWSGERAHFSPGPGGVIARLEGVLLGLGICYDAGFPEFSRAYAHAGVDAIVYGSAFATGVERDRFHIYHPARAVESGAAVAVSNAVGLLGASTFHGDSAIYAPSGRRTAHVSRGEGIATFDVEPGDGARARASLNYLEDLIDSYSPTLIAEDLP